MEDQPILGCPLNISEGRSTKVLEEVSSAAAGPADVLDVSSDPDHNRTVITLAGSPREVIDGALAAASRAVELIDLRQHLGVHPRIGAVDVIPFTPYRDASMDDAVMAARACAKRLWDELGVPSFLYDHASPDGQAVTLPWIRRHAFKDLAPSFGSMRPHFSAGASAVGARGALVAFNVNLSSDDLELARSIASELRRGDLGDRGLRTLGLRLESRGHVQVSMNLTRPDITTALEVLAAVETLTSTFGTSVVDTEFVGLVPQMCLGGSTVTLRAKRPPKILETELEKALESSPCRTT
jgi:glutamate formiminotransferase